MRVDKKKIGIITIWDLNNYGNRLQNYAVTHLANQYGLEAVTLVSRDKPSVLKRLTEWIKELQSLILFAVTLGKKRVNSVKKRNFRIFTKLFIPSVYIGNDLGQMQKLGFVDFLWIGSDQVWNTELQYGSDFEFGGWFDSNKVVCIAPSFGVERLSVEDEMRVSEHLFRLHHISVRERTGCQLIERISGKKVPVLIDPTMMLDADEWRKIEKRPLVNVTGRYMLLYFLGPLSDIAKKEIEEIKKRYHLKEIVLLDIKRVGEYVSGPAEFLYLINHAELILTDSFHACVFSILFNKPFLAYERVGVSMSSRLSNLFETLEIPHQFEHEIDENIFRTDYDRAYQCLDNERSKFRKFLLTSMQMEEHGGE